MVCPQDGTRHHVHCWQANGNRCTAYGCTGAGEVAASEAVASEAAASEAAASEKTDGGAARPQRPTIIEQGVEVDGSVSPSAPATIPQPTAPPGRVTACGQGCVLLAIALAIVLISIACFGLWAMADFLFIEILEWNYRLP